MGQTLLAAGTISSLSGNPAVTIVLAAAALGAVVLVWAALMVRKALIVITAVFAPLAFAGSLADVTVGWTRALGGDHARLSGQQAAAGPGLHGGPGPFRGMGQAGTGAGQSITQVVTGLLVLALAGFTPWMALKLVHFVGDQAHHVHMLASTSSAGLPGLMARHARPSHGWCRRPGWPQLPRRRQRPAVLQVAARGAGRLRRAQSGSWPTGMPITTSRVRPTPTGRPASQPATEPLSRRGHGQATNRKQRRP